MVCKPFYLRINSSCRLADSSRAPSYFSKVFQSQLQNREDGSGGVKTLYIDRDPATFQDIARHLQGKTFPFVTVVVLN